MSIIFFKPSQGPSITRYIAAIIAAALLFLLILLFVKLIPGVAVWDYAINDWIQQLRHPTVDTIMLSMTLLGDMKLAFALVAVSIVGLVSERRWWLGIHLACVALSAMLCVSILKTVLARARPEQALLDSFSFPSGHACAAALASGLLALLLAQGQHAAIRHRIYAAATFLALCIAFSRLYLSVHWLSDVIAGLALGYALIMAFAWQLHTSEAISLSLRRAIWMICLPLALVYVAMDFSRQAPLYGLDLSEYSTNPNLIVVTFSPNADLLV